MAASEGMSVDPWIDPSTEAVRAIHLDPLVRRLSSDWLRGSPVRLLELGCGDMLLARLIPAGHVVDGYDPSEPARNAARAAAQRSATAGSVFDDRGAIPLGVYDGVVISSVLQYLPDAEALTEMLRDIGRWLRPGESLGAVATDVPLPGGSRVRDARDLTVGLARRLGPLEAMRALVLATRRSPGDLRNFSESEVAASADRAELDAVRLDQNLSPFRTRATYLFQRI